MTVLGDVEITTLPGGGERLPFPASHLAGSTPHGGA